MRNYKSKKNKKVKRNQTRRVKKRNMKRKKNRTRKMKGGCNYEPFVSVPKTYKDKNGTYFNGPFSKSYLTQLGGLYENDDILVANNTTNEILENGHCITFHYLFAEGTEEGDIKEVTGQIESIVSDSIYNGIKLKGRGTLYFNDQIVKDTINKIKSKTKR